MFYYPSLLYMCLRYISYLILNFFHYSFRDFALNFYSEYFNHATKHIDQVEGYVYRIKMTAFINPELQDKKWVGNLQL